MSTTDQARSLLYSYPSNKHKLSENTEKLTLLRASSDVHAQSYEPHSSSGPGDPVSEYVSQLLSLEAKIESLRSKTSRVERVIEECESIPDEYYAAKLAVMKLRYFQHLPVKEVAFILQRHVSTVYRLMESAEQSVVSTST